MAYSTGRSQEAFEMKAGLHRQVSISDSVSSISLPPYQECEPIQSFDNPVRELAIRPSTCFTIQSEGTRCFRLPGPSAELSIAIFNGLDTSVEPTYVSTRAKRSSGNAILRHRIKGELLSTTYRFGPFRDPEIRRLNTESRDQRTHIDDSGDLAVKIQPSSMSRSVTITPVDTSTKRFKWQYVRTSTADGKRKVIALSMHDLDTAAAWRKDKILAVLVRTNDTRTPGTTKRDAGNGGQLILDAEATLLMDEELIIATCLLMLKKEIDRQRARQGALIAAAASGGG